MTHYRESLLRLLAGAEPGGVVWTADISYWIAGQRAAGRGEAAWDSEEGYLRLCRELEIMPYYWYDVFWLGEPDYDEAVRVRVVREGDRTTRTWSTPAGEISEETVWLPESVSQGHRKFALASERDLDVFLSLLEHRRLRPAAIGDYPRRLAWWREFDGIPSIAMPRSPLAAFFYEWAGVEQGVYLIMDHPRKVRRIFEVMEEQEEEVAQAVCEASPPLIHFADNMSADNMAGFYDEWMAPAHRRRLERFHAAGIRCAVHLDGVVQGLLGKLAALGFDAVEALTPQPGGDLPVERMREEAGSDTVILWGGVPGILFAPPYHWREVERHVRGLLELWRGSRFVLGVADQVPPDGNIEFCRRIAELVKEENR